MENDMKCFRVWFCDGTAYLIDAKNKDEAKNNTPSWRGKIKSIECIGGEKP
jgi:hypothetical protein